MNYLMTFITIAYAITNMQAFDNGISKQGFDVPIYLKIVHKYVYPKKLYANDTIVSSNNNDKLVIIFKSKKGDADFWFYDKQYRLKEIGHYLGSLDTLKEYITTIDPVTLEMKLVVLKFFQPIKNGKFLYYSKKGKLVKEENYKEGILPFKNVSY